VQNPIKFELAISLKTAAALGVSVPPSLLGSADASDLERAELQRFRADVEQVCNLYSITTNQAAIAALFRRMNRHVSNLPPMPGVFPDFPAPVVRNAGNAAEMVLMRWGMPPPPRTGGPVVTNIRNRSLPHCRGWLKPESRCLGPANSFAEYAPVPDTGSASAVTST
jgi:hypothetical protein